MGKTKRKYSEKVIKLLWGLSRNQCAFPGCNAPLIVGKTDYDPEQVLGHIAHIYSASDDGPRANSEMSSDDRNSYDNLILLCRNHHGLVDCQDSTYTAEQLLRWKIEHAMKSLPDHEACSLSVLAKINFAELELVANELIASSLSVSESTIAVPPEKKIEINKFGSEVAFSIKMYASKSREVEKYISSRLHRNPKFADRLRSGFLEAYSGYYEAGVRGDELFLAMLEFASGGSQSNSRRHAGGVVLTHLFIICDIFEKEKV